MAVRHSPSRMRTLRSISPIQDWYLRAENQTNEDFIYLAYGRTVFVRVCVCVCVFVLAHAFVDRPLKAYTICRRWMIEKVFPFSPWATTYLSGVEGYIFLYMLLRHKIIDDVVFSFLSCKITVKKSMLVWTGIKKRQLRKVTNLKVLLLQKLWWTNYYRTYSWEDQHKSVGLRQLLLNQYIVYNFVKNIYFFFKYWKSVEKFKIPCVQINYEYVKNGKRE